MNVQYAVKKDTVYVLEVNPRASRTVPFVSKATGIPWAKIAAKLMVGKKLSELGIITEVETGHISVKESVFPFKRFLGVDPVLGPEMKSTGEVMGIDRDFGIAFAKSQIAAGQILPLSGAVFISVSDKDKSAIAPIAKQLSDLGFTLVSTAGTAEALTQNGLPVKQVLKVSEGRPSVVDLIKNREINLVINTPTGRKPKVDEASIRSIAVQYSIPYITTIAGAHAAVRAIESLLKGELHVMSLQEYHK
jgi:carbamoyl-phosphate synthase large subunit